LASKAGAVAVLAHPGRTGPEERDAVVAQALEMGVDGVEVWHLQHDEELRRRLSRLVERSGPARRPWRPPSPLGRRRTARS
jgi:predicted metal-dependent phosphoesterase TrpH